MQVPTELGPGSTLGPYTLIEPLGKGASATVYLAKDTEGRSWAVKARRRGSRAMDRRFLREFESMRLLRVPGVVRVQEAGVQDDVLWFSMDLVWGRPFIDVIREEKFRVDRVRVLIDLGIQLFDILHQLHDAGFVHRDVKPSNVLVDKGGKVQVLDFGIGRYFSENTDTLSQSGEVLGTIPYMAPEQIAGLPFDHRIDLFSAGIMLHEGIAGARSRPRTTIGWIPRICMERLDPLACRYREVPLGLSKLIEQLTHVSPADRPSARSAANRLRDIAMGVEGNEWPEPLFVDPGSWWQPLEGALGGTSRHPPCWIVDGPRGSGRSRIAEQLLRMGLMQGAWPLKMQCRVAGVGEPLAEILTELLGKGNEEWHPDIVGDHAPLLRQTWPQLPLPQVANPESPTGDLPTPKEVARAAVDVVCRAAEQRHLLVVVHRLENVDEITQHALELLAPRAGERLGLLLLHESRWATASSTHLITRLRAGQAGYLRMPSLDKAVAERLAASLCPHATPGKPRPGATAAEAVTTGLEALAAWRKQLFSEADPRLWPLAVFEPLPSRVFHELVAANSPLAWVVEEGGEIGLDGETGRRMAESALPDRRSAAAQIVNAYTLCAMGQAEDVATLHLLAGDRRAAWEPAANAALQATRYGRYLDARKWLLLLDTLPTQRAAEPRLAFEIAHCRAVVALQTEHGSPREDLVLRVEGLAETAEQEFQGRLLRSEFKIRTGEQRQALVTLLRMSSPSSEAPGHVGVRALLLAVQCRLAMGQLEEARRDLQRADQLLREHPDPLLTLHLADRRADLLFAQHDLSEARTLCSKIIRGASAERYVRGLALAASRLGQILRMMGRRREAEHHTRSALEAFSVSGDLILGARSGLALATLICERGDAVAARHQLDETIRRIRALHLDHLLPTAMRVALQVATLRADPTDAALALSALEELHAHDPETAAVMVRWWRTRGETERALEVPAPIKSTYGHVLWHLERARAGLPGSTKDQALADVNAGLSGASTLRFEELELYANLLLGVLRSTPEAEWTKLVSAARQSHNTEIYLGALEMSARRLAAQEDEIGARMKWRTLRARSKELGYRPGEEEAAGWLGS